MNIVELVNKVSANPHSALYFEPPVYRGCQTRFFDSPEQIITINNKSESGRILRKIEKLSQTRIILALMNYEFGYLTEDKFSSLINSSSVEPFALFYVFPKRNVITFNTNELDFSALPCLIKDNQKLIKNFRLNTTRTEYIRAIKRIREYIEKGETYQTNYTVKGKFETIPDPAILFLRLLFNQSSRYNWYINGGKEAIISISPELFFHQNNKAIITKPMKGTVRRGINLTDDSQCENMLRMSSKELSENVMIVDLLRNDLGRISEAGSVKVSRLFETEKYETLYQMISTITGRLEDTTIYNTLANIFPSGSVTGAPKIRTMEIIKSLEKERRRIYTGSIGTIEKNDTSLNVAIRTLVIDKKRKRGEIGLGSGITWDSNPLTEYKEVKLKGRFLTNPPPHFEIFESVLIENGVPFLLDYHLKRMQETASYFLFKCNVKKTEKDIYKFVKSYDLNTYKLKIILNKWGCIALSASAIKPLPFPAKVRIPDKRVSTSNRFQYFKTSLRSLYDSEYRKCLREGYAEVIFLNERDEIAEGSFTNVVVKKGKTLYTPPIEAGILNGVYRQSLIDRKKIAVKSLCLRDLKEADKILLINSVRKEIHLTPDSVDFGETRNC